MSRLPIIRPAMPADDLDALLFEDVDLLLNALMEASIMRGVPMIQGRTFRGCRLQGPAIVLVSGSTTFDDTDFGNTHGDIRNILVRPIGDKVVGAVVLRDCIFDGCQFNEVGFTGTDAFIKQLFSLGDPPEFGRLS